MIYKVCVGIILILFINFNCFKCCVSNGRVVDIESDTGPWPAELARGDVNTAGSQQIGVVEKVVSQMHDFSFMLVNTLSLPPNCNNLHS